MAIASATLFVSLLASTATLLEGFRLIHNARGQSGFAVMIARRSG